MRAMFIAVSLLLPAVAPFEARSDRLTDSPEVGPRVKLSKIVKQNLNEYGNEFGLEIGELTLGLMEMQFDLESKNGHFHLGGGDPDAFRLRIDSHVAYQRKAARVQARLDLSVAGYGFALDLPEFDMKTESVVGQRAVAFSIPFLEGSF